MIQEKTREADIPWSGSFELTPLCNLDCKMCYVHLQDPSVKHQMLSGEQWKESGGQELLYTLSTHYIPSKIVTYV